MRSSRIAKRASQDPCHLRERLTTAEQTPEPQVDVIRTAPTASEARCRDEQQGA